MAWGVALFVAAELALGGVAEVNPRLSDPFYGDKLVKLRRRVEAADPGAPVVVMLGSSRTGLAFHGRRAEESVGGEGRGAVAFNFGIPSAGPVTQWLYLRRLLDDGVTPDLLLLEVLPSMLAAGGGPPLESQLLFGDRLRHSELDAVARYGFDAARVQERWTQSRALPAYGLRFSLMTRLAPSWLPGQVRLDWSRGADENGFGSFPVQTADEATRARSTARASGEYAPFLANYTPGGPVVQALRDLLALCRERGVEARLVLMPEGPTFRGWFPPEGVARLMALLRALEAEFGVPLVNAREWLPEAAFVDSHHMFLTGAEEFTDRMTREVVAPFLRGRAAGGATR